MKCPFPLERASGGKFPATEIEGAKEAPYPADKSAHHCSVSGGLAPPPHLPLPRVLGTSLRSENIPDKGNLRKEAVALAQALRVQFSVGRHGSRREVLHLW